MTIDARLVASPQAPDRVGETVETKTRLYVTLAVAVVAAFLIGLGAGYEVAPRSTGAPPNGNEIVIPGTMVNLAVAAGPMPDMFHFVIGGLLNATLVIQQGATVTMYFRNIDTDMSHSMIVTSQAPPYAGATTLSPAFAGAETVNATAGVSPGSSTVFQFVAGTSGTYWYVCGVPGHAASGMYGELIIGG